MRTRRSQPRTNRGLHRTARQSGAGGVLAATVTVILLTLVLVPQGPSWALGPRDTNDGFDSAVQVINHTQTSPKFMGLPDNPQDYYWIELGRGQALEAFMIILQNSTKGYDYNDPGKVNFDLEAYGPLDHTKPLDWSRTWDQFETLSIVAAAAGKYHFRIYQFNGSGNYNFMVTVYNPPTVSDGGVYSGYLKQASDHATDWYRVYLKGGDPAGTVDASLSFDPNANLDLNIADLWAKNMMYYVNVSWTVNSGTEAAYGAASYTGYYYIKVYAYHGYSNYQLRIHLGQAPADGDNEPAHARLLDYNTSWMDHVDQAMDKYDWFQVHAQPLENISLHLTLLNGWHDIFSLFLLDADLNVITEKTNYIFTPHHGTGVDDQFWDIVDGGAYYIVVTAKVALGASPDDLSDSNAAADYRLVVNMSKHPPKPPNTAPTVRPGHEGQNVSMLEDSSYHVNLNDWFQPNDGDQLSFSVKVLDGQLTASADMSGLMTLIPGRHWYGTGHLNITATDPGGLKAYLNVRVDVLKTVFPPFIESYGPARNARLFEGKAQVFWVNATDMDSPVLFHNWSVDGKDQQRTVPNLTYTPDYGTAGPHTIVARVSDGQKDVTWEWDVTVAHTNRPPVIVSVLPVNGTVLEDGKKVHLSSVQSDPDNDRLNYEWSEGLQVLASGPGNRSDINQSFSAGSHTVVLTVSDPSGALDKTRINFTVKTKAASLDWVVYAVGALVAVLVAMAIYAFGRTRRKVDKARWDKEVEKELGRPKGKKGKKKMAEDEDEVDEDLEKELKAERKRRTKKRKTK
jgi:hypothetical protein